MYISKSPFLSKLEQPQSWHSLLENWKKYCLSHLCPYFFFLENSYVRQPYKAFWKIPLHDSHTKILPKRPFFCSCYMYIISGKLCNKFFKCVCLNLLKVLIYFYSLKEKIQILFIWTLKVFYTKNPDASWRGTGYTRENLRGGIRIRTVIVIS